MTYDLTKFDLGEMLKCSLKLRETASYTCRRLPPTDSERSRLM